MVLVAFLLFTITRCLLLPCDEKEWHKTYLICTSCLHTMPAKALAAALPCNYASHEKIIFSSLGPKRKHNCLPKGQTASAGEHPQLLLLLNAVLTPQNRLQHTADILRADSCREPQKTGQQCSTGSLLMAHRTLTSWRGSLEMLLSWSRTQAGAVCPATHSGWSNGRPPLVITYIYCRIRPSTSNLVATRGAVLL